MSETKLIEYFEMMNNDDVVLSFNGVMTHELLVVMAELLKEKYNTKFSNPRFSKKLFGIFIELMQNISYYSKDKMVVENGDRGVGKGIILVKELEIGYVVMAGNIVSKEDTVKIGKKIDLVNSLNGDKLKELYKKTIKEQRKEGQIGGGIGFIDIARKSSEKISYSFKEMGNNRYFFEIKITIKEKKEETYG